MSDASLNHSLDDRLLVIVFCVILVGLLSIELWCKGSGKSTSICYALTH